MMKRIALLLCMLTLLATPLTYAKEFNLEKEEDFVSSILGSHIVEDAVMRQLAFTKAPPITVYTVKKGDNLFRIALNHQVSLEALMEWNNLDDILIHPGDQLIIKQDESSKKHYRPVTVVADASGIVPKMDKTMNAEKQKMAATGEPSSAKEMTVIATAYTAYCEGCSGTTAYGINLRENPHLKVIAVDPKIIPLGTKVWVEGYGYAIAGDTGGAIKGNKIDVFIPSHDEAMQWGVKKVKIKILE